MTHEHPPQAQDRQPGRESEMTPRPRFEPRFDGAGRLEGKVALITGGDSGIGRAVAVGMAREGACIAIVYLDEHDDARETVALVQREGGKALALAGDIGEEAFCFEAVRETLDAFGRLDILVNNAAIFPKYPFDALTEPQWHEMQQINVWGCFVVMRAAATLMRKGGRGGAIITVSSVGSPRTAVHNQIAYNASKAAIDSMTISAAYELAPDNIRVNSIQPGAVRPLDPRPHPPGHQSPTGPLTDPGRILLGRPALAEEVAGPILMLAGAAGAYITGQAIVVDGGFFIS
jgi:NAD(P)-dependent dehydrogenase (short-subunit alcohol dehydrogenase family)